MHLGFFFLFSEGISCEDRLRQLSLLSLEKSLGTLHSFHYLKKAYKKAGERLFIWTDNERTRDNVLNREREGSG